MAKDKKYYWLKLKRDFFKRHDIQIVESMTNGKDYILFYLKLLVESVDHEGELRFSETIPYNDKMLATITNTDVDKVRSAMKVFTELKMIEVMDDETIYMAEVAKMTGHETYWAETKRKQRSKEIGQCPQLVQNVQPMSRQELEIEIDLNNSSSSIATYYLNNINPTAPQMELEQILDWQNDFTDDVILRAMQIAINNKVRTKAYIESILKSWLKSGLKTIAAIEEAEKEWRTKAKCGKESNAPKRQPKSKQSGLDYLQSVINGGGNYE